MEDVIRVGKYGRGEHCFRIKIDDFFYRFVEKILMFGKFGKNIMICFAKMINLK
jgi:hypothetical protein